MDHFATDMYPVGLQVHLPQKKYRNLSLDFDKIGSSNFYREGDKVEHRERERESFSWDNRLSYLEWRRRPRMETKKEKKVRYVTFSSKE